MDRIWESLERRDLSEFVDRMARLVGRETQSALLGVGVLAAPAPRPLILGNVALIADGPWSLTHEPFPSAPLGPIPVRALDGDVREELRAFDVPRDTVVLFVVPPEPIGLLDFVRRGNGIPIYGTMRGTLGPRVDTAPWGPAYLTAGHVTGPPGSVVDRLRIRWHRRTTRARLGNVVYQVSPEPDGMESYDVSVVVTERGARSDAIERLSQFLPHPVNGTLVGGVSGRGFGAIQGALAAYSDASGSYTWRNSWMMWPGSIGAEGDSGASVVADNGAVIGMLVGGSRIAGSGTFGVLYVQDFESIARDVLHLP